MLTNKSSKIAGRSLAEHTAEIPRPWFLIPVDARERIGQSCDGQYAEVDRRDAGQALGLLAFLPEEGEGEVDALNLTEPCLVFGAGSAGQEVVLDLVKAWQHFRGLWRVWGIANTSVRAARDSVWPRAATQLNLSSIEVFLELRPFLLRDVPVLVVSTGAAAPL